MFRPFPRKIGPFSPETRHYFQDSASVTAFTGSHNVAMMRTGKADIFITKSLRHVRGWNKCLLGSTHFFFHGGASPTACANRWFFCFVFELGSVRLINICFTAVQNNTLSFFFFFFLSGISLSGWKLVNQLYTRRTDRSASCVFQHQNRQTHNEA